MILFALGVIGAGLFIVMQKPARAPTAPLLACPACGSFVSTVGSPGDIVRCRDCGAFAQIDAAQNLAPVAPNHLAATHVFETYLPEAPTWPAICCVCGAPPTRAEPMKITYAAEPGFEERVTAHAVVGVASLGTMKVAQHVVNVTERYGVPHCNDHGGGARLAPAGIAFRSYTYHRAFVQLNRGTPGT